VSEGHRVFSLKYRPMTFEEMTGQPHVRQTLVNTLFRRHVGHGYIFSGPRGVGKTTAARLFAKALNCAEGPGPKICNRCPACVEISGGNSLDVIEMDGASNRKIEDVRALRENVRFAPTSGRYKIYIIDEVHMLTQEAFNALLKTLEEPPEHVVFILATTDPQKIPETIHSRCQELEFHRLSPSDLEGLIRAVCQKEKISIDVESVGKLAEWADGSARDALVALEQAAAYSESDVREDQIDRLFGWVDQKTIDTVVGAVWAEDRPKMFEVSRRIEDEGRDMTHFLVQLAKRLKQMWLAEADRTAPAAPGAPAFDPDSLLRMISSLLESERNLRSTRQPGLFLAIQLIDLIELKRQMPVSEVVRRVEQLESRLRSAPAAGGGGVAADDSSPAAPPNPGVNVNQLWSKLVEALSSSQASLASHLKEGRPVECSAAKKTLTAVYGRQRSIQQKQISADKNAALIDAALSRLMGSAGWHLDARIETSGDAPGAAGRGVKDIPSRVRAGAELLESRGVARRE